MRLLDRSGKTTRFLPEDKIIWFVIRHEMAFERCNESGEWYRINIADNSTSDSLIAPDGKRVIEIIEMATGMRAVMQNSERSESSTRHYQLKNIA